MGAAVLTAFGEEVNFNPLAPVPVQSLTQYLHPNLRVLCPAGCFYGQGLFRVAPKTHHPLPRRLRQLDQKQRARAAGRRNHPHRGRTTWWVFFLLTHNYVTC